MLVRRATKPWEDKPSTWMREYKGEGHLERDGGASSLVPHALTSEKTQSSDSGDIGIVPEAGGGSCSQPYCEDNVASVVLWDAASSAAVAVSTAAATSSPVMTAATYAVTMKG